MFSVSGVVGAWEFLKTQIRFGGCLVDFERRWQTNSKMEEGPSGIQQYVCDYSSSTNANIKTHLMTPSEEKLLACAGFQFVTVPVTVPCPPVKQEPTNDVTTSPAPSTSNDGTQRGGSNYVPWMPFICELCVFRCRSKKDFQRHIKEHHAGVCHECGYRADSSKDLRAHLMTHVKKPYACNFCDYRSATNHRLKQHLQKHTGEKPYACDTCDYRTTMPLALKNHMMSHTGEKPYACDGCDYRSKTSRALKQHAIKQHHANVWDE